MRFLADESCDFAVVRSLRSAGQHVLAVAEFQQGSVDQHLMEIAYAQRRILITEGKDFGWLAYVAGMDNPGVILIRFPASKRITLGEWVLRLVVNWGGRLTGSFVVLRPGSVRISATPATGSRSTES